MSDSPKLQLQQLIALQGMDDEIAEHNKLLAEIPLQINAGSADLEEKKKILSIAKEEIDALQKNVRVLSRKCRGKMIIWRKPRLNCPQ